MRRRRLLTLSGVGIAGTVVGCAEVTPKRSESGSGTPTRTDSTAGTATPSTPGGSGSTDQSETEMPSQSSATTPELMKPTGWPPNVYADYETSWIRAKTRGGETLDSVYTAIANTEGTRYTGLSDAEIMPDDAGMLFVFDSVSSRTFVMREMDFGIDIVYADSDGVVTKIHHATAPEPNEDGNSQRYPGTGKYVLEVNYNWTRRAGMGVGDVLDFDL